MSDNINNTEKSKGLFHKDKRFTTSLIIVFISMFIIFCFEYYNVRSTLKGNDLQDLSNLGQYLGGTLGTIISLLAFLGLILAYMSQREELNEQRREIEENRIFFKTQIFENNFYELMKIWINIKATMKSTKVVQEIEKKMIVDKEHHLTKNVIKNIYADEVFDYHFKELKESCFACLGHAASNPGTNLKDLFQSNYNSIYESNGKPFIAYYKILYQIFKIIDKLSIPIEEKKIYSNILRAQISDTELKYLFFYGLSKQAEADAWTNFNCKIFFEKYNFFEHFDYPFLVENRAINLRKLYEPQAFDKNKLQEYNLL